MAQNQSTTCDNCSKAVNAWLELTSDGNGQATYADFAGFPVLPDTPDLDFCSVEFVIAYFTRENA